METAYICINCGNKFDVPYQKEVQREYVSNNVGSDFFDACPKCRDTRIIDREGDSYQLDNISQWINPWISVQEKVPLQEADEFESEVMEVATSQGYGLAVYSHRRGMWDFVYTSWASGLSYVITYWRKKPKLPSITQ